MKRDNIRRFIMMMICVVATIFIIVLLYTTPNTGLDTTQARNTILENHLEFTGADNAVSAVYLNFRLWDTLFEALVLLVSAVAVISFSRSDDDE